MEKSGSGNPDPGSRIKIPDHISESLVKNFFIKNTFFLGQVTVSDPDPGSGALLTSGMEDSQHRKEESHRLR